MIRLLAIVPARAGSKGVPGKNKAPIRGRPLIDYTLAALAEARSVDGVLVTSDDPEILAFCRTRPGVRTIERPPHLASDEAPTSAAVAHALRGWGGAGEPAPEALLLAQPTTPLRTASDIDDAFALFEANGRIPVVSACRAEGIRHPTVMYRASGGQQRGSLLMAGADENGRRQEAEPVFQRNGAIYLCTTAFFRETGRLRNDNPLIFEMPWVRSINIDTPGDLTIARALIESRLLDIELGLT